MILYVSSNPNAHPPRRSTLRALRNVLDDRFHVWANVSFRKWEFDWLVYCDDGWFCIVEEKDFPSPVRETAPGGKPWILVGGSQVANPGDQVEAQSEAFRMFVRRELCPKFFPGTDYRDVNIWRWVYSPMITSQTSLVQPRWGLYARDLEDLSNAIANHRPLYSFELDDDRLDQLISYLNETLAAVPATPSTEDTAQRDRQTAAALRHHLDAAQLKLRTLSDRTTDGGGARRRVDELVGGLTERVDELCRLVNELENALAAEEAEAGERKPA